LALRLALIGKAGRIFSANTKNLQIFLNLPRFPYEQNKNCSTNSIGAA
jgi:hypothetical protein